MDLPLHLTGIATQLALRHGRWRRTQRWHRTHTTTKAFRIHTPYHTFAIHHVATLCCYLLFATAPSAVLFAISKKIFTNMISFLKDTERSPVGCYFAFLLLSYLRHAFSLQHPFATASTAVSSAIHFGSTPSATPQRISNLFTTWHSAGKHSFRCPNDPWTYSIQDKARVYSLRSSICLFCSYPHTVLRMGLRTHYK